ncbi:sensor histidine kinase [Beggiatoa leptomitoformis]|uniref:histidine kinase n=1 Tax=Beggiatoa leptomitoformis TaxID=288004 RepID=A0A2N9YBT2_9GAMM|nr:HAMP domain-containing sensor histidine kinase [Beggiatoa leptomitoformis]ALG69283.2 HAMP domain-containing protein [Beggiatoa leptomitoformis]AUI67938.1 HAMP domain-containing protein [Beggiatoa leptomitoformis]
MKQLIKLLNTSTFRVTLIYMGLFGMSALLLMGFIYWATVSYIATQTDETIEADVIGLNDQYRRSGLVGLVTLLQDRIIRNPNMSSIYAVIRKDGSVIVGNLNRVPPIPPDVNEWITFEFSQWWNGKPEIYKARARFFFIGDNYHLLIGRDIRALEFTQHLITNALLWGLAITLALALFGGLMMSWSSVRRLESINNSIRRIMHGDLSQRIPNRGTQDDFDQLAENLNAMLAQLEKLMNGIRQVTDNVAHDLRTPLTRLRNRLEELRETALNDNQDQLVEKNIAEADKLLHTFNALLRIGRLESGCHRSELIMIDLSQLLLDAIEFYEVLATEKQQTLTTHVAPALMIEGDRDLLFQAIVNLLDNAIKYTPENGYIDIALQQTDDNLLFSVTDTGQGIPDGYKEKVLERFFRMENSRSTAGNGLGLSLVAAVVSYHQAQMVLEDNTPTGLRVVLTLPQKKRDGRPSRHPNVLVTV